MTGIISALRARQVDILSDSAGYWSDGTLAKLYRKCVPVEGMRAAVAVRGASEWPQVLADELESCFDTFDAIMADGGGAIEKIVASYPALTDTEPHLDVFLAGWSEARDRPEHYFLTSFGQHGVPVWQWSIIDPVMVTPMPTGRAMRLAHCRNLSTVEQFDPVIDGLRLMTAQRFTPVSFNTGGTNKGCGVGGEVLLTSITREGVEQRYIHSWPDEIGEPIRAEAAPPANLNRHQRRALARKGA